MAVKRLGLFAACSLVVAMVMGVAPSGAAGPTRIEKLHVNHVRLVHTGEVGGSESTTVGSREAFTGVLYNDAAQFGSPVGRRIGRVLVDCAVLSPTPDGLCTGIAHVPDGFFVFAGNSPFTTSRVRHYAIIGGAGPYATARGQITITYIQNRAPTFVVELFG
jgi:hypothetical protein